MSGIIGTSHSKSKIVGRSQDTAKAWVNIATDGTKNNDFNVSTVARPSTGTYNITFATAMPNTNYAVAISYALENYSVHVPNNTTNFSTTGFTINPKESDSAFNHPLRAIVFGD